MFSGVLESKPSGRWSTDKNAVAVLNVEMWVSSMLVPIRYRDPQQRSWFRQSSIMETPTYSRIARLLFRNLILSCYIGEDILKYYIYIYTHYGNLV